MKIEVLLPKNRSKTGTLTLKNDNDVVILGPLTVLGNGVGGKNQLLPNSDTPTGRYKLPEQPFLPPKNDVKGINSFGTNSRIIISPISGNAKKAAKTRQMELIRIHGGALGSDGNLRKTEGCLRLSNDDMKTLIGGIEFETFSKTVLSVTYGTPTNLLIPSTSVSVDEVDISYNYEQTDGESSSKAIKEGATVLRCTKTHFDQFCTRTNSTYYQT